MTLEEFKKLDKDTVTYSNITRLIDQLFPEYVQSDQYYDEINKELAYVHLGNLTLMAFEDLDNRTDTDLAIKLLEMTNHVINNYGHVQNTAGTDDLNNLFGIEVFESLAGYKKGAHLAKQYLNGKALQSFHDTTQHYHTEEFLNEYYKVFGIHPITATEPDSLYSYMWNELQRPDMNPPEDDQLLSDIRTHLELDEDLIAGTLSYITAQKTPPEIQLKNFYGLQQLFKSYREQLNNHQSSEGNQSYIKSLLVFIDDLERISSNTGIWMWNNGIK